VNPEAFLGVWSGAKGFTVNNPMNDWQK
jgi:hypothetical protein